MCEEARTCSLAEAVEEVNSNLQRPLAPHRLHLN